MSLYPLRFHPKLVEKIWGGRKFQTVLGKPLPAGKAIGESWELYDFPPGVVEKSAGWNSAIVADGPLAGQPLHGLMEKFGRELMGDVKPARDGQFPLLIKFLDAREDLSVQVHPDQTYAEANPEAHLKSEAWYVIQNDPGARILKGVTRGTTAEAFAAAIARGDVEQHIEAIPVKPGDCHYLPSGTVHALGAGILVAEVQTPSDTTFRVYDFNRVEESTGKKRDLHVEQAMKCIDFGNPSVEPAIALRSHVAGMHSAVSSLVESPFFKIEKVRFSEGVEQPIPYDQPVVWIFLEGSVRVSSDGTTGPTAIKPGQVVLLPAGMKKPVMTTTADSVWLEVTFPG
jgi:mannose-6-phosphate isomerase